MEKKVDSFGEKYLLKNHYSWKDYLVENIIGIFVYFTPPFSIYFTLQYFGLSEALSFVILIISLVIWVYLIDKYKIVKRRD